MKNVVLKLEPLLLKIGCGRRKFIYSNTNNLKTFNFPKFLRTPIPFTVNTKTLKGFLRYRAMATSTPQSPIVNDKIQLTHIEKRIFDRLLATLRHFNLQTQLRVAGGWVRDKLLGKESNDIDIALDNMLGSEFVEKVSEYLSSTGEEAQGLAVIPCNPDQSKHLETARMRIFDMWIDFVNLRSEDYSENSRIPMMRFGTAQEDAYRRDLTINGLFYNINTSLVEDFTGRGLADLISGHIVTPLPPKETFMDDPLRVLRAIRFGARFGFILDEKLREAASCDDVKAALAAKISRERIGTEIDLMISGNQPVKAMTNICDLQLFSVVFSLPHNIELPTVEECDRLCISYLDAAWNLMRLIECSTFNDEKRRLSLYAAMFLPLRKMTYKDNKGKKVHVANYLFRNSLKRKASDAETVINVYDALEKFLSLVPFLAFNEDIRTAQFDWGRDIVDFSICSKLRVLTGFLLREIKDFWRVALLLSTLIFPIDINPDEDLLDKRRDLYKTVENAIMIMGLDEVWDVKPLVNGNDIMSVLQLKSGGPLVREWQRKLLAWQLAKPDGTAEECMDWMKETHLKRVKLE